MWRAVHDPFPSRCLKTEGRALVKDFSTCKVEKSFTKLSKRLAVVFTISLVGFALTVLVIFMDDNFGYCV